MTIPPYNPQVPLVEDTIDDGQPAFLTNFETIFSAFNANHVSLSDPINPGNHAVIELIKQMSSRTTEIQELSVYSKNVGGQTEQLYMRYPLNGKEFQLTNFQIFDLEPTNAQVPFFSFLPGGIIVYFGFVLSNNTTTFNIDLTPAICTNIMGINIGCIGRIEPQPNVSLEAPIGGFYQKVILSSSSNMTNNFYLIFGNT